MTGCPVCQTEYIEGTIKCCTKCGWDVTPYPPTFYGQIPKVLLQKEQAKLAWARKVWERLQVCQGQLSQAGINCQSPAPKDLSRLREFRILEAFLEDGRWKDADRETVTLMLKTAKRQKQGYMDIESLRKFPCDVLRIIDELWVQYSHGHFGFSVQNQIWKKIAAGSNPDKKTYEVFGEVVGWRSKSGLWYGDILIFDLEKAPQGHLPLGRMGDIALAARVTGWFGGFGLERILTISSKLDICGIK
ncbi:MAG: GUN4 domain-containing protein [Scytonema sp. PMC 1069.18]|nr:GUN4 domain-containing protein [Scytonema sp. PMC 1069.18]MEC4880154.1 GUN4 domain-containing protein [Scytonema sp. PMC 1070.18]